MSAATWAAAHRRSILFLAAVLALAGGAIALRLPVALFPHVEFPRVAVSIEAGDRPADQMVIAVTQPLEQAVRAVPGVVGVRSTTSRGSAELSINFAWGGDMVAATLQVESAINQVLPSLPAGTGFKVRRMDPTVFPVLAYSLVSHDVSPVALRDTALYQLVPLLSAVEGVARVDVLGGASAEYRVEIDPGKLAAHGITLDELAGALTASNVLQAVGRLEDHYKLYLLLSDTRVRSLAAIEDTVVRSGSDGVVRLSDLAQVYPASTPQWRRVTADGTDAVLLQVYQQPGSNTVRIVADVAARLADYRARLPAGIAVAKWYDQSELITAAATSVRDAIAIGVVLAALVLLVFLRSLRITLIAAIVVPAVLATTMLLLDLLGMSLNIMTLGGMAAAVGLIVDDTIVMVEHLARRLHEAGGTRAASLRAATAEFTVPLAGSSAATTVIFAPLALLDGVTGAFFKALSLTMAAALVISFLLAWLVVPLLTEHLLASARAPAGPGPLARLCARAYAALMARLLPRPWLVAVPLALFCGAGYWAYQHVGSGFLPAMDEGGFVLDYRAPSGTSLAETDRLLRQVEAILRANPYVDTFSRRTGLQLGGGLTEANEGDFFVRLKPLPRPPIETIMDAVRHDIDNRVPLLDIELVLLMEDLIGDLTAVPQPIEIKLFGDDSDALLAAAPAVAQAISAIDGVVDVNDGVMLAGDALEIVVDRDKAALEGIAPQAVTRQVDAWFTGLVPTQVQEAQKLVGIRVWVPGAARRYAADLPDVPLVAADGHRLPLSRVARIVTDAGQPQITRDDLKQMVAVTARISGRDLGSAVRAVRHAVDAMDLGGKGLYYTLGGLYHQQQVAFRGLLAVALAAVALVFVLLLALYESFRTALAVMSCPLLAMNAVFLGLWASGIELNITALMGMTMIIGIVTEIAIFYFSEYHALVAAGSARREALVAAGINRLRPLTMTTLAAILALLPLALALGQGAAMQQPLAVAIIAGLLVQMPLVLVSMPLLYLLLGGGREQPA
ncbi:MAG: efflux RND transporter permease subunit [Gammaproteobacteria bacterium]|nr:efflux RND transporter permease subunit [Gammaproteobacteria bacterium]